MRLIFDALVIIHPEYGTPINSNYLDNLETYIQDCNREGKPVFLIDSEKNPIHSEGMRRIFEGVLEIPDFSDHEDMMQREIDYMCGLIERDPETAILGFGGVYASHCVYAYAAGWCQEVLTRIHPAIIGSLGSPERPIRQGLILDDII